MTGIVTLHPQRDLEPGRYALDPDGRLHPLRFRRIVRAVAIVTVKAKAGRPVPEPPRAADRAVTAFRSSLAKVQDNRATSVHKPAPKIDGEKLAAAIRARPAPPPPPKPRPKRQALSNDGCTYCGIPGSRGCDHFLPYVREVHG
jgi:hypothetical protein